MDRITIQRMNVNAVKRVKTSRMRRNIGCNNKKMQTLHKYTEQLFTICMQVELVCAAISA